MRVIAGRLGGRMFDSPRGHRTHPMSDKIRGALFNMLGDLGGLNVLDAYAGSGALSIEAISRGAVSSLAIDLDKAAFQAIQANLETLGLQEQVQVLRKNVATWSNNNIAQKFDVVVADPPYNDVNPAVIGRLTRHVKPGGVFILSWPGGYTTPQYTQLKQVSLKSYGDAQLAAYLAPAA